MKSDYEKLKELASELKEIHKDNRRSNNESKFTTFFRYLNNEDITKTARKRFFKNLMGYQYYMGRCKRGDVFSEESEQ